MSFSRAEALAMLALSERLHMQTDLPEDAHKQHNFLMLSFCIVLEICLLGIKDTWLNIAIMLREVTEWQVQLVTDS